MSTWNYRVFKHLHKDDSGEILETTYELHETHYNDAGAIVGWTENAIAPSGTTPHELSRDLTQMQIALSRPTLDLDEIEAAGLPYVEA